MADVLSKAEVARIRALVLYEGSGERWDAEELADSHEHLRARLDSAVECSRNMARLLEAEQDVRGEISQELFSVRARLESAEGERMETTPAFLRLATYLRRLPRVGLECLVGSGGEDLRCWSDGGWCDGVILACGGDDIDPFVDGEHVGWDFDALRRVFGAERLAGACKRVCRAALGAAGEEQEPAGG